MSGVNNRQVRFWSFADCAFDEANWSLTVGGKRVAVEGKPLELLRELLLRTGNLVSKADLLDAIWPDTIVVEASLPTAVHKLRVALNDEGRATPIIETVPRLGYRLAVPVEVEEASAPRPRITLVPPAIIGPDSAAGLAAATIKRASTAGPMRLVLMGAGLAVASVLLPGNLGPPQPIAATLSTSVFSQRDAATALRRLDVEKIEQLLAAGWDPTTKFDDQRNGALNILLGNCEWDPGHDRRRMLLMARTLIDGGDPLDYRNVWGDTPYSIAKADRYCGPDHPVTRMMHTLCYAGGKAAGDRCLADYKIASIEKSGTRNP